MGESTESLSLDNLRLSDGDDDDDDDDAAGDRVDSDSSDNDDCRAPSRTSHQSTPPASIWCSHRTVRQQPEVRLLLRDLERARSRREIYDRDPPTRALSKVRPFSAVGSSLRGGLNPDQKRPATSLGHATGTFSVDPSTRHSTCSVDNSCFDGSEQSSFFGTSDQTKHVTFPEGGRPTNWSSSGFCKRVLSSTRVRGDQWSVKHRPSIFDPVLQKVTVHITNFRKPAEEVTLSMCYSSCVTSHNSRVVTDDIQRLSGRKELMTRQKAYKVEERLAIQRKRRHNLAMARIREMQRAARRKNREYRGSDLDARKTRSTRLSMPALLVCERASARQDRICTRTFDITQANTSGDTYMSLNKHS